MDRTQLLNLLQQGIPLIRKPFAGMARELSISVPELLEYVKELKEQKIIRRISPIYDTKMLGYQSCLTAFQVPESQIAEVAEMINRHPGVSHNYRRNHQFNLWYTIAVPPDSKIGLKNTVAWLARQNSIENYAILHAEKTYKIGVKLDMAGNRATKEKIKEKKSNYRPLSNEEKQIIKITQQQIPLEAEPFAQAAKILAIDQDTLLTKLQEFHHCGIMRRFAALLNHRKAGFSANGMSVWQVSPEQVDEVGYKLAAYKAVSHCYRRNTTSLWPYNLFAMVHGKTHDEVEDLIGQMASENNLNVSLILYSDHEFKKTRLQYFIDDYYTWEKEIESK